MPTPEQVRGGRYRDPETSPPQPGEKAVQDYLANRHGALDDRGAATMRKSIPMRDVGNGPAPRDRGNRGV